MEMTNRFGLGRGLRQALEDLEQFARELTEHNTDEDSSNMPEETQKRSAIGIQDDPIIPWLRVAIMSLALVAVGIVLQLIQQF
ncbi:MAG: hypothetical protein QNI91_14925 [Arenicellales bacterium]|nr:hypothetical protein [Arenicellales bacterium]